LSYVEIIRQNALLIVAAWWVFIIAYLAWRWYRTKGKILVRIKTPIGEKEEWVKPNFEGDKAYLVFEKESRKKAGWKAEFTNKSLIPRSSWLGLKRFHCIDIFPQATKAIEYNFDTKTEDQPKWDKHSSKEYIEAKILKQMGEGEKLVAPGVIWIVVIVTIIILILEILPYIRRF